MLVIRNSRLNIALFITASWVKAVPIVVSEVTLHYSRLNEIMKLPLQFSINTLKESLR